MKRLLVAAVVAVGLAVATEAAANAMCFFQSEQLGGVYKVCYYRCANELVAMTFSVLQICPLRIHPGH